MTNRPPDEPPRFDSAAARDHRLPQAIAYCATCNRWAPVNLKLTGYRFDCPDWDLNNIHVAAVIGDRWSDAAWVKRVARLERYQAYRGQIPILRYVIAAAMIGSVLWIAPWSLAHRTSALIGLLLVIDVLLFTSANALSSQRPRFPPRSIILAVAGFAQLAFGFALVHAGLECHFNVGDMISKLDLGQATYFSIVTLATVGYGDITPPLDPSRVVLWIVVFQILCGLYYLAVFVATTVSWVRGIEHPLTLFDLLEESTRLDREDLRRLAPP